MQLQIFDRTVPDHVVSRVLLKDPIGAVKLPTTASADRLQAQPKWSMSNQVLNRLRYADRCHSHGTPKHPVADLRLRRAGVCTQPLWFLLGREGDFAAHTPGVLAAARDPPIHATRGYKRQHHPDAPGGGSGRGPLRRGFRSSAPRHGSSHPNLPSRRMLLEHGDWVRTRLSWIRKFGNSGFAMSLAFGSVMLFAQFTLGRWLPSGKIEMKPVFGQVFLYALVLGMVLMFVGIHLPSYVERGLHLVGKITIPLLLLSLGFALAKVSLAGFGKGMLLATVHLIICACIGVGVAWVLPLQEEQRKLVILLSILPSATINILIGQEAGDDLEPLTIFVTCTNLWLVVSLPVAIAILL